MATESDVSITLYTFMPLIHILPIHPPHALDRPSTPHSAHRSQLFENLRENPKIVDTALFFFGIPTFSPMHSPRAHEKWKDDSPTHHQTNPPTDQLTNPTSRQPTSLPTHQSANLPAQIPTNAQTANPPDHQPNNEAIQKPNNPTPTNPITHKPTSAATNKAQIRGHQTANGPTHTHQHTNPTTNQGTNPSTPKLETYPPNDHWMRRQRKTV